MLAANQEKYDSTKATMLEAITLQLRVQLIPQLAGLKNSPFSYDSFD